MLVPVFGVDIPLAAPPIYDFGFFGNGCDSNISVNFLLSDETIRERR